MAEHLQDMTHVVQGSVMRQPPDGSGDRSSRLLRGILDACLLALIAQDDRYGYEIAAGMREAGLGFVRDGTIYPLLARLEHRGYLDSYLAPSISGPRRRYYTITAAGRMELTRATGVWRQVSSGVDAVLNSVRQSKGD